MSVSRVHGEDSRVVPFSRKGRRSLFLQLVIRGVRHMPGQGSCPIFSAKMEELPWIVKNYKPVMSVCTLVADATIMFSLHYSGYEGLLYSTLNFLVLMTMDLTFSENFAKNLKILNANGFSNAEVYQSILTSYLLVFPGTFLLLQVLLRETVIPYISHGLLIRVAIMLTVSETVFTFAHVALHQDLSKYHLMHHCCKHTSYSTNFVFHPIDLLMELGIPLVSMILTNLVLFKDNWALLCALTAGLTIYAQDHDEYLQRPHSKHHSQLTSPYTAYFDSSMHIKDAVRPMVKSE
ncbi:hypothetical protein EDD86DRAFT_146615 [Gorgonomyces haynaldii]|nr:hypothetical protein EDD86DRAFT_146615 [Gorgonomyces haynaldii]